MALLLLECRWVWAWVALLFSLGCTGPSLARAMVGDCAATGGEPWSWLQEYGNWVGLVLCARSSLKQTACLATRCPLGPGGLRS